MGCIWKASLPSRMLKGGGGRIYAMVWLYLEAALPLAIYFKRSRRRWELQYKKRGSSCLAPFDMI